MTTESTLIVALDEARGEIRRLKDILEYEQRESAAIVPMAEEILCLKDWGNKWRREAFRALDSEAELKKQLTYSMMAASAEAERVAELERQIDEALAVLRLPGLDNNGGPADLAEEVRVWNGNLNRYMRDGHHITAAQIDAAWEHATHGPSGIVFLRADLLGIERCPSGKGWIKT